MNTEPKLRILPLGGSGEIGRNCTAVIQGDDILIVDCGLSFPNEEMPGVDIVIPDFTFLRQNKEKIRGLVLTHAHEDHIGAVSYLMRDIKCPIYGAEFTLAMLKMKLEDKLDVRTLDFQTVKFGEMVKVGKLEFELIRITHSIPESGAVAVHTELGVVLFTGDFKFDFSPVDGKLTDITRLSELGKQGVLCLLSDSTNVDRPGWGPSETTVSAGLQKAFLNAPGRVLLTTFASNIHRMQQAFTVAHQTGRKVAVAGRRMENTIDLCNKLKYIKIPADTWVKLDQTHNIPDNKLVILSTGSQGEPMAALSQMSREEYSRLRLKAGDTIVYSARPIPGNEGAIWRVINRLFRLEANVIYDDTDPVHVSGHAYQEEIKMMINLTRPFYLAPVHGEPRHQFVYRQLGQRMGYPDHRIFTMTDGYPLEFDDKDAWMGELQPCGQVLVDNAGNTGIDDDVLRDRLSIAKDGILIPIIAVDVERGAILGAPTIETRGFAGPDKIVQDAVEVLAEALDELKPSDLHDVTSVKRVAAETVRIFVNRKAKMRPLVVPTVVEV
ncbi:MAG: ribonuclease J [Chthonomonas sp.]|nr:ribonuclease J [Chthonomonas sp.]